MKHASRKLRWVVLGILALSIFPLQAQIVGSKHDLSGKSGSGTGEVCVYCHTPHGSNSLIKQAPLWNRALPSTTYIRYSTTGTSSFDSTEAAVGSISLACLSCHDGSLALDAVINAPGSGGYNASGAAMGTVSAMTGSPIPMLGADLSNDHPISIPYAGGGARFDDSDGARDNTVFLDKDFKGIYKGTVNGNPIWWVDTSEGGAVGTREKKDLPLYARTGAAVVEPFVECGSCHDPHNAGSASTTSGSESVAFLRMSSNNASQICTSCHIK